MNMTVATFKKYLTPFLCSVVCIGIFYFFSFDVHAQGTGTPTPNTPSTAPGGLVLLSGIPYVTGIPDLPTLLNVIYKITIIVGAIFAVLRITLAGIQYMGSDNFGTQKDAKAAIQRVLIGLLILLSTALILETIFGNVNTNILQSMTPMNVTSTPIPQLPTNVNPVSTQLNPNNGCNQSQGAGGACPTGSVAVIQTTTWGCEPATNIPSSPGQSTFSPVPEGVCPILSGIPGAIQAGNTIGGISSTPTLGGKTKAQYEQSLLPACQAIIPGGVVTMVKSGIFGGDYVFACTAKPI